MNYTLNKEADTLNINGKPAIKAATPDAKNLIIDLHNYATGGKVKALNMFYAFASKAWLKVKLGKAPTVVLFNVSETEKTSNEAIKLVREFVKGKPQPNAETTKAKAKAKKAKAEVEPVVGVEPVSDTKVDPEIETTGTNDTGAGDTGAGDTGAGDTSAGDTGAGDTSETVNLETDTQAETQ